jgi:hypothetical protein
MGEKKVITGQTTLLAQPLQKGSVKYSIVKIFVTFSEDDNFVTCLQS